MTANIQYIGIDIDGIYENPILGAATSDANYQVGGVDISNRYSALVNASTANGNISTRIPPTGILLSNGTDLSSIFVGKPTQYSLTAPSGASQSVSSGWISPQIWTHVITVTFSSAAALTSYFNYGGRIQISASQSPGTTADNTLATMLSDIGSLIIYDVGHYRTGAGGTITNPGTGGSNIGTTPVALFNTTDGSPYTGSTYTVSMVANASSGSATVLTITTVLTLVTSGSVVDTYTGTYTSTVHQRNYSGYVPPTQSVPTFSSVMIDGGDGLSSSSPGSSALQIKTSTGTTTNGLYWIKASPNTTPQQVWADMNTDGGGWMLVARTYPGTSPSAGTFGWRGTGLGAPTTYGAAYQLDLLTMYNNGYRFTDFLFGHQSTNNSNNWGPFIYKMSGINSTTLMTVDNYLNATYTTVASNTSIYGSSNPPGMQQTFGWPTSGTSNNMYFMRDVSGFTTGYGIQPYGMTTTYINASDPAFYSGPWVYNTLTGNNWDQNGSSSPTNIGGTTQVMVMVR